MKRVTTVLALAVVAAAALLYSRTLNAADTDFSIYFENSTLALKSHSIERTTYLPLVDIVRHLNLVFTDSSTPPTFTIQGANTKVSLTAGSASVAVNDQAVLLQNPIRRESGQWLVPLDFLSQGLAKVTGFEFRYRPGNSRVFAGNVSSAELTVSSQTQGGTTRITLRSGSPIDVELQRDTAQRQAVLVLKGRPVDPARERMDFKDRMVQSIVFDDSDGAARLVISTTDEVRDIRLTPYDEKRTYLLELAGELPAEATAAPPPPPPAPPDANVGPPLPNGNLKVIAIDAGHGGIDHGASNADALEKDITLALARRLRMELQSRLGASVVLTRDSDVELSSEARTETANNNQAELFISLHVGYSPNKTDSGASIFVMKPDFTGGLPPDPTGDRLFLPWYMAFRSSSAASQAFAKELQTGLNQTTAGWKFGIRSAPIGVLASLTMPAVAIEAGNLNNQPSAQTLTDPAFQTRFSAAVAEAVSRFSQKAQGGRR
jgi:N-acetylmuramoyl-L-alanine amidase